MEEYQEVIDSFFTELISIVPDGSKWLLLSVTSYAEFNNLLSFKVPCDDSLSVDGFIPELCLNIDVLSKPTIIKEFLNISIYSNIIHQAICYKSRIIFFSYDSLQNNSIEESIINRMHRVDDYTKYGLISEILHKPID